jgi:ribosomal protein S18 acetylase RimI-like enzyme
MRRDSAFRIRGAVADDLPVVAALFREYVAELGIDLSFQGFEAEVAGLPGRYAPPAGALLLALGPSGEALGCVAVRPLDASGTCEMKRLHVRPAARGGGLGRALACAALEFAAEAGHVRMRLDTLPSMRAAHALYQSPGFVRTAPYYDTPLAGTVFMEKTLRAGT